ncbi:hypothetical protein ZEAMMB73_Zm00001d000147 [Zea mays]|nr:hypothetical protein ZEAMMB73_Zm00001d000147 [Zea mays]
MGCAVSRPGVVSSPSYEDDVSSCSYNMSRSASASADLGSASASASAMSIWSRPVRLEAFKDDDEDERRRRRSGREAAVAAAARLGSVRPCVEGEQAAAGWPAWLSAVAAEAVHGWVPLRADGFEKLEKVGQGTYSSVFRARELATGRLVALKKVRFDSVEPESVRFMAREILILRRLQGHPNVVGLEGLVTSRSSPSIYLVFEYLEHDLAGLSSSPDITFTESQIKCYMRQLLEGLAHCHARGAPRRTSPPSTSGAPAASSPRCTRAAPSCRAAPRSSRSTRSSSSAARRPITSGAARACPTPPSSARSNLTRADSGTPSPRPCPTTRSDSSPCSSPSTLPPAAPPPPPSTPSTSRRHRTHATPGACPSTRPTRRWTPSSGKNLEGGATSGAKAARGRSGCPGGTRACSCRTRTRATCTPRNRCPLWPKAARRWQGTTATRGCSSTWSPCRRSDSASGTATTAPATTRRRTPRPCPAASRSRPVSRTAALSPAPGSSPRPPVSPGPRSPGPSPGLRRRQPPSRSGATPRVQGPRTTAAEEVTEQEPPPPPPPLKRRHHTRWRSRR